MKPERYFAMHRVFTGIPVVRGYIYDRMTGKPVRACDHRHRKWACAQACAERMLREFLKAPCAPPSENEDPRLFVEGRLKYVGRFAVRNA